jgi:hypothetical protein
MRRKHVRRKVWHPHWVQTYTPQWYESSQKREPGIMGMKRGLTIVIMYRLEQCAFVG